MKISSALVVAALLGLTFSSGCYQVPETGRRAMNLVDEKEVAKMSVGMFDQMKRKYRVSRDRDRVAQLKRVGERLQSAVSIWDMPDADWEFVLFDVPNQVNAFAMAGGKVGVFSGLFKIAETDDELASVIAHEIAHVTAKHVHQKLSRELLVQTGGTIGMLGAGISGVPLLTTELLGAAYGIGAELSSLAYDRDMEKEADYIGLMYMARAGYDPEASIRVLERLEAASAGVGAGSNSTRLSTHPSEPERIIKIMDALPKARDEQAKSMTKPDATPVIVR